MKPILVRAGSVVVKIYRSVYAGKPRWEIRWRFGGKIHRLKRSSKTAALLLAQQKAVLMANGRTAGLRLSDEQVWEAEQSFELLKPHGVGVLEFVRDGLRAREQQTAIHRCTRPVADVVEQFLSAKQARGLSASHLRDLGLRLRRFGRDFREPFGLQRSEDLAAWLDRLRVGPRSWNNYRSALGNLFDYGKTVGLIPKDSDLLESCPPRKLKKQRVQIFTPGQMSLLLEAAGDTLRPALAIGAFAGLRSEEISRLTWSDFNWRSGYILLREDVTKTAVARSVPILDNLRDWLEPWQNAGGKVSPYAHSNSLSGRKRELAERVGMKWTRNALRKSFITYRVAMTGNIPQTALEAGNSPAKIHAHYLDLATPSEAREWFGIRPKTVTSGLLKLQFR